ncbi:MAG: glycosyltransferase [Kofleriaceae bacterium]|nr:glycosyltransferase [Kofleriaceae bacterium]
MESLLVVIGLVLLVDVVVWHRVFVRALARAPVPAPPLARYPSITVIRPIRGLDVDAAENFRAALATSYPGEVETLFVFDDEEDAALPVVREIVAEHRASGARGSAEIMISGTPPAGRTGKLHAMIAGTRRARGTLIAFGDSDSRPAPELLTQLVEALFAAPDIGCTFAPVVVTDPPETIGDVGYALMLDGLYAPGVARAAGAAGRLPFIMGQLMVFRPEALAAIGGPECADGQLVDDMYIGRCVARAGYANVMINAPLVITNRGTTLRRFLENYRRWMLFGQGGIPMQTTWPLWLRGLNAWLATALLVIALVDGAVWPALIALGVLVAHGESSVRLHRRHGGAPVALRLRWFAATLFLLAPFVVASMAWRRVDWRGRAYSLGGPAAAPLAR